MGPEAPTPQLRAFALTHIAAAAAALSLGIISSSAFGLGLGRLTVQSALGETLKAEIDVTSLSTDEAGTLKVRIAPPDSYRATGVEYNSVLTGTQVQVARRDGRTVLRVSSDRAVQEPFVDVILELTWSSGRLVREYTLLFDPPAAPRPVAAPPTVAAAPVMAPAPAATEPVAAPAPATTVALTPTPRPVPAPLPSRPRAEAPMPAPRPAPVSRPASEYAVKPGDTLSRIASKTQVPGVSLDQMLVGLYRSNPDAFIDRNMNLLKAGSVLQVPSSDSLGGVAPGEARQVIQAQSADFSAYRRRLAGVAPTLKQDESERQSKGRVQAAVEDRKPAAVPTPDKLTLSKAASAVAEAKASQQTQTKDTAARVAELTRNVEALKQLSTAAKPPLVAVAQAPAPAPAPVIVAPLPAPVPAPAPAPAPLASAAPTPPAPTPVVAVAVPKPEPKPVVAPPSAAPVNQRVEPGMFDQLLDSPLLLPLGAVLLAALGAFGFYRLRGRKGEGKSDTGFIESRLQPDSFFGATGGGRVDTRESAGASSMTYSLSQLDAIGDVDPVAEADVYLAYGRDLQAEEILKEALRANPERLAIRLKLLEVYAKRRDTKGFEQLAIQLYAETHGVGDDWSKAQEMGRQTDPDNPLYHPGGAPARTASGADVHPEPMDASTLPHTVNATVPSMATDAMSRGGPDTGPMSGFDLDLDLDLAAPPPSPLSMAATQAMTTTVEQAPLEMDFDLSSPASEITRPGLSLDLDAGFAHDAGAAAQAGAGSGLDFDLSDVDLELPSSGVQPEPVPFEADSAADQLAHALEALGEEDGDPLMRQLELAEEFRQIGDTEGAREVLQELIAKSGGPLRDKAQAMLNELR